MHTLMQKIRSSVIGANAVFESPFGQRPLVYADYTASGKSVAFIEDYIRHNVLPWYANTHTDTSFTGAQTTCLREQARDLVKQAVNASEQDKVIFCGAGATSAINKIIDIMGLRKCEENLNTEKHSLRPVVFIGPYEHHSNELPWRESIADVVTIPFDEQGQIDQDVLAQKLTQYKARPIKIGSFSAASNVTGILTKVKCITALLKQHGALSFWDYAAAGPYVPIDMNAIAPIDAVFLSPHKFVGGPGTCGVLVVKEALLNNSVPALVGGGTVSFVSPNKHRYVSDTERKEEGGTPAIVESIRTGLVFKLQQEVGTDAIMEHELAMVERVTAFFENVPEIELLGPKDVDKLSIFSFRIKHQGKDLHYGFVTALLNDLFGIQVRGGCSCAGPYAHILLNMDEKYSHEIETQIELGNMLLRPGWTRLNFNYFLSEDEVSYILRALKLVAEHGWRLLPFYAADLQKGLWRYAGKALTLKANLQDFSFADLHCTAPTVVRVNYEQLLTEAEQRLLNPPMLQKSESLSFCESLKALIWFSLPQDALDELKQEQHTRAS
jgi:selenocysteine lyase/cysteine desulfurase